MSERVLTFGEFTLDPDRRLLLEDGRPVRIGSRALDILVALLERAGEVVPKDDLIARAWPDTTVEEASLRVHVAALRKALRDGKGGRRFVVNVPGRGYSFVGSLTASRAVPSPAASSGAMLPAPLTRLIGREEMVRDLAGHLRQRRLVTLVGPGGIGKTTVALAVAETLANAYPDGVVLVDLAPVNDPALVSSAVTAALGLAVRAERHTEGLLATVKGRRHLILLDSCEHVVEAAAHLAEVLLRGAPGSAILATSREALRAGGEWVQRMPPLGLPPAIPALTAAEAMRFPAVQLFVERAAACLGGFTLTDAQAPVVADICRRLDGIALAIELAAGRMDAFGLHELAMLLDDRLRVLMRGRRTALPRHQTLRAALDWSYGTLTEPEKAILRRLAVFAGGFSLAAARAVAQQPPANGAGFDDNLACLVAKSLVAMEAGELGVTYRLLDTTRAYARERLDERGEAAIVAQLHAAFHRALFEQAAAEWETRPTAQWLGTYARRVDELRAALIWAFGPDGDPGLGVALTVAAVPLWFQLSLVDEGIAWAERALDALGPGQPVDDRRRMQLYAALGWTQMYAIGRVERSTAAWRAALELAEALGDRDYQQRALWALWADCINHGAFREAFAIADRFRALMALEKADATDRLVGERMTGASLHFLGEQARARAHIDHMIERYVPPSRRSHVVRYQFDQLVTARITRARILWLQGFPDQAMQEVEASVARATALNHTLSLCNVLAQSACPLALLTGNHAAAERYLTLLRRHAGALALDVWRAYADGFEGEFLARTGHPEDGLPMLRAAVDELRRARFTQYLTAFLAALGDCLIAQGQAADGLAVVEEALARCESTGERWCLPELLRLKAEALIALARPGAEPLLHEALVLARGQGVPAWELRAATSAARLLVAQRRRAEARTLLAPVVARFTEGFETSDMRQGATLIATLEDSDAESPRDEAR
ncbi:ATP-binding protein [Roseomonas fluvialis]|uniref:ATPase n=1 Tax=Roseomonas fluvialis TaxID=1750527 RepID=A0ABM7XYE2_9PROT|nr:winged helix-turn-helix domain-containing protein [Roseomonas fluvialis]BDG70490.1 ATPase [Roseomonas fluvialis]